jgi:hypothetical protein
VAAVGDVFFREGFARCPHQTASKIRTGIFLRRPDSHSVRRRLRRGGRSRGPSKQIEAV